MKPNRSRSRNLQRDESPSVICLPALPPLSLSGESRSGETAPQLEFEVTRAALPLPPQDEPHIVRRRTRAPATRASATTPARAPAKRPARSGSRKPKAAPLPAPAMELASPADSPEVKAAASESVAPLQPAPGLPVLASLPLPRNLSLALVRTGTLARIGSWLRSLVMVKRPVRTAPQLSPATAAQIKALRRDVAMMQRTLDQLLKGSPS